MEFSPAFKAANDSVPSTDGTFIASTVGHQFVIRTSSNLQIHRIVNLDPSFASKVNIIKWSPIPQTDRTPFAWNGLICTRRNGIDSSAEKGNVVQRVLLADDESIKVFDVRDEKWTATISLGCGGIKNVEFGRNADEVVIFSDFQLMATVWNLVTSKHIEILHPKFATRGYGYRPHTSHFAILTRPSTHDVVSIHHNTSYDLSTTFTLPTVDAQGLKWSPCGRWLAVWDSPVVGYRVLVYTASGHLYRTHEVPCEGLGIKTVEWSPSANFLTIGSYDGKMCFLNNYTFSPVISMHHTRTVKLPNVTVWSECLTSARDRYYAKVQQPTTLPIVPFHPSDPQPAVGVSAMAFSNPDGKLVATKNDNMPSTVWIWSMRLLQPYAVLVHMNPIKSISWHPTVPDLLMIQCNADSGDNSSGVVYLWSDAWKQPRIVQVPMEKMMGSMWAKWVNKSPRDHHPNLPVTPCRKPVSPYLERRNYSPENDVSKRPMLLCGDRGGFMVGYVEDEPVSEEEGDFGEERRNVDWDYYSPANDLAKQSLLSRNTAEGGSLRRASSSISSSLGEHGLGDPFGHPVPAHKVAGGVC